MVFDVLSFVMGLQAGKASGGSSGGGGLLPAGVYLSKCPEGVPSVVGENAYFEINEELYCAGQTSKINGPIQYIHKWNGSTWDVVLSNTTSTTSGLMKCNARSQKIEFNGKLHMSNSKTHYVFDGTSVTTKSDLPGSDFSFTVYKGKLYGFSNNTYKLYEWDEDTDTWTELLDLNYTTCYPFGTSDKLYLLKYNLKEIYIYENGTLTLDKKLDKASSYDFTSVRAILNDCLYTVAYANGNYQFCRYNFKTKEEKLLGIFPHYYRYSIEKIGNRLVVCGDFSKIANDAAAYYTNFDIYIVEESE